MEKQPLFRFLLHFTLMHMLFMLFSCTNQEKIYKSNPVFVYTTDGQKHDISQKKDFSIFTELMVKEVLAEDKTTSPQFEIIKKEIAFSDPKSTVILLTYLLNNQEQTLAVSVTNLLPKNLDFKNISSMPSQQDDNVDPNITYKTRYRCLKATCNACGIAVSGGTIYCRCNGKADDVGGCYLEVTP